MLDYDDVKSAASTAEDYGRFVADRVWRDITWPFESSADLIVKDNLDREPTRRGFLRGLGYAGVAGGTYHLIGGQNDSDDAGKENLPSEYTQNFNGQSSGVADNRSKSSSESDEDSTSLDSEFSYNESDLPYDSLMREAINDQSEVDRKTPGKLVRFFDKPVNERESSERSSERYWEPEELSKEFDTDMEGEIERYLSGDSNYREETNYSLISPEGKELPISGKNSITVKDEFREYIAGLDYLGQFEREVETVLKELDS